MLDNKLDEYEKTFHDSFPTYPLAISKSDEEIIEMIDKCIKEKKDVYEMGYLKDDLSIKY